MPRAWRCLTVSKTNNRHLLQHALYILVGLINTFIQTHHTLPHDCQVLGSMEEAKPLYEESLQLRTVVYGERSIKVAESKQNLATILDSQGG